jgi:hypothetical protein
MSQHRYIFSLETSDSEACAKIIKDLNKRAQRRLPGAESERFTICHGKIAWSHIKFFRSVEQ